MQNAFLGREFLRDLTYAQNEVRQWIFNRMLLPLQDTGKAEVMAMVGIVPAAKPGSEKVNRLLLRSRPSSAEDTETRTIACLYAHPVVNGSDLIEKMIPTRF